MAAETGSGDASEASSTGRVYRPAIVVVIVGLVVTLIASLGAARLHDRNEDQLLERRALAGSSVLGAAVPGVRLPLATAAGAIEETGPDAAAFEGILGPLVGDDRRFASASIWAPDGTGPLAALGSSPLIAGWDGEDLAALFDRARRDPKEIAVVAHLEASEPRLGYAVAAIETATYSIYAESSLPADRMSMPQPGSAFEDVDYALYLGASEDPDAVLLASRPHFSTDGRAATEDIPFGDTSLRLVMVPRGPLGGPWSERSPWLVALAGLSFTLAAGGLTARVLRSRATAQRLASENAGLYREQRAIARKLQHSMLPDTLPEVGGVRFAAWYEPGVERVDVGGDWYDAVEVGTGRLAFVVGDVSGRGIDAAIVMARLRHGFRAYAMRGDGPGDILAGLDRMLSVEDDGRFATVVCAVADLDTGSVTIANAGHLDPLVLDGTRCETVETRRGPPVGAFEDSRYDDVSVTMPAGGTLLLFTDGLVERRAEAIDASLERLRATAGTAAGTAAEPIDALVGRLVRTMRPHRADDDVAVLAVGWPP